MDFPKPIIDAIENNNLVIFVGAGASRYVGLPDWKALALDILEQKREYIENSDHIAAALRNNVITPLEVLDKISPQRKYVYEHLEASFSERIDSDLHKNMAALTSKFITTNYDNLIEDNAVGLRKIVSKDDFSLSRIDKESSYVLKIHGDLSTLGTLILFTQDYVSLYNNDNLSKFQLQKILSENVVVFIGFSFEDHYIQQLFEKIQELYDGLGSEKYILSTKDRNLPNIQTLKFGDYEEIYSWIAELSSRYKDSGVINKELSNESVHVTYESKDASITLESDGTDIPPSVEVWAGRGKELRALDMDASVFFITGIGGQGKSALAAQYIDSKNAAENYDYIDWRDFKEIEHNFESKIINMIVKLSDGKIGSSYLVGKEVEDLITLLVNCLKEKKVLVVLDNVDSYIDLDTLLPSGNIGLLFEAVVTNQHSSKIIFTCRPFIRYAGVGFYQLRLDGLSLSEVKELFAASSLPINKESADSIAQQTHEVTRGHPLWIKLVLAQAKRGLDTVQLFLERIGSSEEIIGEDDSTLLSEKILTEVWDTLNEKQKLVLRSLAEMVRTESVADMEEVVSSRLNHNQLVKALNVLINLNLIVTKNKNEYIELHPLVKEFIRKKYPRSAQSPIISLLIKYYDKLILVLKSKSTNDLSFDEVQTWSGKAELYINKGDLKNALVTLRELAVPIKQAGYVEEFIRVSCLFLDSVTWTEKALKELSFFDNFLFDVFSTFVEFGAENELSRFMGRYQQLQKGFTDRQLLLLSTEIYKFWTKGDFKKAIEIGEQAEYKINRSNNPDIFTCLHRLALAQRDSKDEKLVNKALKYFLVGESLSDVIDGEIKAELTGPLYGNVGRCLEFLSRKEDALKVIAKSYRVLDADSYSDRKLNLGYASKWMYEILMSSSDLVPACYFLINAEREWRAVAPVLANKLTGEFNKIRLKTEYQDVSQLEQWRIEKYCRDFVADILS